MCCPVAPSTSTFSGSPAGTSSGATPAVGRANPASRPPTARTSVRITTPRGGRWPRSPPRPSFPPVRRRPNGRSDLARAVTPLLGWPLLVPANKPLRQLRGRTRSGSVAERSSDRRMGDISAVMLAMPRVGDHQPLASSSRMRCPLQPDIPSTWARYNVAATGGKVTSASSYPVSHWSACFCGFATFLLAFQRWSFDRPHPFAAARPLFAVADSCVVASCCGPVYTRCHRRSAHTASSGNFSACC
jgi:hypothetical protein